MINALGYYEYIEEEEDIIEVLDDLYQTYEEIDFDFYFEADLA